MGLSQQMIQKIHCELVGKAIEELHYEEVLSPAFVEGQDVYELKVCDDISYYFSGRIGAWGNVLVDANTLKKVTKNESTDISFTQFFLDVRDLIHIDDETLARYLEEANQTLYSEIIYSQKIEKLSFEAISKYSFSDIDRLLKGHTKIIMNKGRIGWGESDILQYAPESGGQFQLRWIAVHKSICITGFSEGFDQLDLVERSIRDRFLSLTSTTEFCLVPVHPWQWDHYIRIQFIEQIQNKLIIDLGVGEDYYKSQSSLRTLSPVNYSQYDTKVSLSILNTSCVRGIPAKYIQNGHIISDEVKQLISKDDFLALNCQSLSEVGAVKVCHRPFEQIAKCSYRYHELLGAVWREAVDSKLADGEKALPTAALLIENSHGILIKELINKSGLGVQKWLMKYFDAVVLPLYHLQVKYGVGLVAHGQNTILVHENGFPKRLIIKDFHGDLRMSESSPLGMTELGKILDVLPDKYLIHDLYTGHFVTLLRYISRKLEDYHLVKEVEFYTILGESIHRYHREFGRPSDGDVNLLNQSREKVLVNKVRFVYGYSETQERLKPLLGKNLDNPLSWGEYSG